MKSTMKILAAAAIAVSLLCASDAFAASFSLNLGQAKQSFKKSEKGDKNKARGKSSESVSSTSEYPVKVSCSFARGEMSAKAKIEAFFITRDFDSTKDELVSSECGSFTFTPTDKSYECTATSPSCKRTTTTKKSGNRRNRHMEKDTKGTYLKGVVVRVVSDGEVKAVKCIPDNIAWKKAAKQIKFHLP